MLCKCSGNVLIGFERYLIQGLTDNTTFLCIIHVPINL